MDRVFRTGKRIRRPAVMMIQANPGPALRLGVVVARKIFRSAPARNRLRRLLRESFRLLSARIPIPPASYVLVAREAARSIKKRQDADAILEKMLER